MTAVTDSALLAVDLGLHTGLALYDQTGTLRWYRSHNFGNRTRMRRGVHTILGEIESLRYLILEGSGPYATIWGKAGERCGATVLQVSAETWRPDLLLERQQRTGALAKSEAERLAFTVIASAGIPTPKSLDHNAAEAILIGVWGALSVGWLTTNPLDMR